MCHTNGHFVDMSSEQISQHLGEPTNPTPFKTALNSCNMHPKLFENITIG